MSDVEWVVFSVLYILGAVSYGTVAIKKCWFSDAETFVFTCIIWPVSVIVALVVIVTSFAVDLLDR